MREVRWQELTKEECFRLLAGQHLGRVVLVDDRGPVALPVNFVLDQHTVLFRSDEGTKLDVAGRGARVAFEVTGSTRRPAPAGACWSAGRSWRSPIRPS